MKGIILAGGKGSRLYPLTLSVSKQLLSVYNKPMIYYPLSVLLNAGIKDILIISTTDFINDFKILFGDGDFLGINIEYKVQKNPGGLPEAFILGENFISDNDVCLVLGDNIFIGNTLKDKLLNAKNNLKKRQSTIFGYNVNNPEDFGIAYLKNNELELIEEKPQNPKSNCAVVGLYFYTNDVINISKKLKPSSRNELEITSVNNYYLKRNKLKIELLNNEFTWFDAGTHESLYKASEYIKNYEKENQNMVSCIEEVAYENRFINKSKLLNLSKKYKNNYGEYIKKVYYEK